jgi:hypothetical protein
MRRKSHFHFVKGALHEILTVLTRFVKILPIGRSATGIILPQDIARNWGIDRQSYNKIRKIGDLPTYVPLKLLPNGEVLLAFREVKKGKA